jgi:CD36 family
MCVFDPVPLSASDDSVSIDSIPVHRYTLSMSPFLNATSESTNDAYFGFGPNGVVNVSSCSFKADVGVKGRVDVPRLWDQSFVCPPSQIFMSKPHFFGGDSGLLKNVTGLTQGNTSAHETFYDVEPVSLFWLSVSGCIAVACVGLDQITGTMFQYHKRWQVNSFLQPVNYKILNQTVDTFFPNVTSAMVPILWFDEVRIVRGLVSVRFHTRFAVDFRRRHSQRHSS